MWKWDIDKKTYAKVVESVPIVTVDAIIKKGNSIILFKRNNYPAKGQWFFPGGRLMKGFSPEKYLVKKVKSETGLDISIKKFVGVYSVIFRKSYLGKKSHVIVLCYLTEIKSGNLKLNPEHSDYKYFKKLPKNIHWYIRKAVKDSGVFR